MGTCNLVIAIIVFMIVFFVSGAVSASLSSKGSPSMFFVYVISFACAISMYYSKKYSCTGGGEGGYEYDGRSMRPHQN
jgi:hypothetical protein